MTIDAPLHATKEIVQESAEGFESLLKIIDKNTDLCTLCALEDILNSQAFQAIFEAYQAVDFPNSIPEEIDRISELPNLYGELKFKLKHLRLKQRLRDGSKENAMLRKMRVIISETPDQQPPAPKSSKITTPKVSPNSWTGRNNVQNASILVSVAAGLLVLACIVEKSNQVRGINQPEVITIKYEDK